MEQYSTEQLGEINLFGETHLAEIYILLSGNALSHCPFIFLSIKKGNTALHISSLAGQAEVVKILVQRGAEINSQSQVSLCTLLRKPFNPAILFKGNGNLICCIACHLYHSKSRNCIFGSIYLSK